MKCIVSGAVTAMLLGAGVSGLSGGPTAAARTAAPRLPVLTLAMDGRSIAVAGVLESGAVNVVATVTKEKQGVPAVIRLNPGASAVQAVAAVRGHNGDFNYLGSYGALVYSTTVKKSTSSTIQISLQTGNYIAVDDGNARYTAFTVTRADHPPLLPTPRATLRSIDFAFRGPSTLHRGELVRFQNGGFLVHSIIAVRVKDSDSAAKLTSLLKAGKDNEAQRLVIGSVIFDAGLSPGEVQQQVITAKSGIYVLTCMMSTQDGRAHTLLGMERTIRITQ